MRVVRLRVVTVTLAVSISLTLAGTAHASTSSPIRTGTLHGDTYVKVSSLSLTSFQVRGPYAVGDYAVPMKVTDANGVTYTTTVEVWYPARRADKSRSTYNLDQWLPASLQPFLKSSASVETALATGTYSEDAQSGLAVATGVFPLVLFSHGLAGFRDQSTYLTTDLASWGFVVAAPDDPLRDFTTVVNGLLNVAPVTADQNSDVADLLATRQLFVNGKGGIVDRHVDTSRVVAFGHSAGGSTVERLASYETVKGGHDSFLKGWIGLAGASVTLSTETAPYNVVPSIPGVIVAGGLDHVVPIGELRPAYAALRAGRRFIELSKAGHQVYADTCAIDAGHGGVAVIASALKFSLSAELSTLSMDGCFTSTGQRVNVAPTWKLVEQIVVGNVRHFFGIDPSTLALNGLTRKYPGVVGIDTTSAL